MRTNKMEQESNRVKLHQSERLGLKNISNQSREGGALLLPYLIGSASVKRNRRTGSKAGSFRSNYIGIYRLVPWFVRVF